MARTVFITGSEGFLGRHTAHRFHHNGWQVVGLGHSSLPSNMAQRWGIRESFTGVIEPNLLQTAFDRYGAPDVLIHAAGTSSVGQAAANPYNELLQTIGATAGESTEYHFPLTT